MSRYETQMKILKERVEKLKWLFDRSNNLMFDDKETNIKFSGMGLSKSSLDRVDKSMDHYFGPRSSETPAMKVGTAFHTLVLEIEHFDERYFLAPKVDLRTSDGKRRLKDAESENEGKISLSPKDWDMIHEMAESVRSHPLANDLLSNGVAEQTLMWNDKETDVLMKGRIDWINQEYRTVIDLKSCQDASRDHVEKDLWSTAFRYNVQASIYTDGAKSVFDSESWAFNFVFVEKKPPYGVQIVDLEEKGLSVGRDQYRRNIESVIKWYDKAVKALEDNRPMYSGYDEHSVTMLPPAWLVQKYKRRR
jgi:hypothetical protein